jgi:hypothetical protein
MGDYPKILLAAPINKVKNYCFEEWLNYIKNFTYKNFDVYFVDNSVDFSWHEKYKTEDIKIDYVSPIKKRNVDILCECQNKIRQHVMDWGYDYYLSLECDVFPPLDVIELLLSDKKDIVSFPYFINQGEFSILCMTELESGWGKINVNRNIDFQEQLFKFNGQVIKSDANGIGCAMIKKDVLFKIKGFRTDPSQNVHADMFFYIDLKNLGIENYLDTSLIVEHRNISWNTIPNFS